MNKTEARLGPGTFQFEFGQQSFSSKANSQRQFQAGQVASAARVARVQSLLNQKIDGRIRQALEALAKEPSEQLCLEGFLHLGKELSKAGDFENAAALLGSVQSEASEPWLREQAASAMQACCGSGGSELRSELLIGSLAREATNYRMILPMLAGSVVGQVAKSMSLGGLLGRAPATILTRGAGARLGSGLMAFAVEVPIFTLGNRALSHSQSSFSEDLLRSTLSLGALKLAHLATNPLSAKLAMQTPWGASAVGQAGTFLGLAAAHRMEENLGLRKTSEGGHFFMETLGALLSLGVGARLGQRLLGEKFAAWQRELEFRATQVRPPQTRNPLVSELLSLASVSGRLPVKNGSPNFSIQLGRPLQMSANETGVSSIPQSIAGIAAQSLLQAIAKRLPAWNEVVVKYQVILARLAQDTAFPRDYREELFQEIFRFSRFWFNRIDKTQDQSPAQAAHALDELLKKINRDSKIAQTMGSGSLTSDMHSNYQSVVWKAITKGTKQIRAKMTMDKAGEGPGSMRTPRRGARVNWDYYGNSISRSDFFLPRNLEGTYPKGRALDTWKSPAPALAKKPTVASAVPETNLEIPPPSLSEPMPSGYGAGWQAIDLRIQNLEQEKVLPIFSNAGLHSAQQFLQQLKKQRRELPPPQANFLLDIFEERLTSDQPVARTAQRTLEIMLGQKSFLTLLRRIERQGAEAGVQAREIVTTFHGLLYPRPPAASVLNAHVNLLELRLRDLTGIHSTGGNRLAPAPDLDFDSPKSTATKEIKAPPSQPTARFEPFPERIEDYYRQNWASRIATTRIRLQKGYVSEALRTESEKLLDTIDGQLRENRFNGIFELRNYSMQILGWIEGAIDEASYGKSSMLETLRARHLRILEIWKGEDAAQAYAEQNPLPAAEIETKSTSSVPPTLNSLALENQTKPVGQAQPQHGPAPVDSHRSIEAQLFRLQSHEWMMRNRAPAPSPSQVQASPITPPPVPPSQEIIIPEQWIEAKAGVDAGLLGFGNAFRFFAIPVSSGKGVKEFRANLILPSLDRLSFSLKINSQGMITVGEGELLDAHGSQKRSAAVTKVDGYEGRIQAQWEGSRAALQFNLLPIRDRGQNIMRLALAPVQPESSGKMPRVFSEYAVRRLNPQVLHHELIAFNTQRRSESFRVSYSTYLSNGDRIDWTLQHSSRSGGEMEIVDAHWLRLGEAADAAESMVITKAGGRGGVVSVQLRSRDGKLRLSALARVPHDSSAGFPTFEQFQLVTPPAPHLKLKATSSQNPSGDSEPPSSAALSTRAINGELPALQDLAERARSDEAAWGELVALWELATDPTAAPEDFPGVELDQFQAEIIRAMGHAALKNEQAAAYLGQIAKKDDAVLGEMVGLATSNGNVGTDAKAIFQVPATDLIALLSRVVQHYRDTEGENWDFAADLLRHFPVGEPRESGTLADAMKNSIDSWNLVLDLADLGNAKARQLVSQWVDFRQLQNSLASDEANQVQEVLTRAGKWNERASRALRSAAKSDRPTPPPSQPKISVPQPVAGFELIAPVAPSKLHPVVADSAKQESPALAEIQKALGRALRLNRRRLERGDAMKEILPSVYNLTRPETVQLLKEWTDNWESAVRSRSERKSIVYLEALNLLTQAPANTASVLAAYDKVESLSAQLVPTTRNMSLIVAMHSRAFNFRNFAAAELVSRLEPDLEPMLPYRANEPEAIVGIKDLLVKYGLAESPAEQDDVYLEIDAALKKCDDAIIQRLAEETLPVLDREINAWTKTVKPQDGRGDLRLFSRVLSLLNFTRRLVYERLNWPASHPLMEPIFKSAPLRNLMIPWMLRLKNGS